MASETQALTAIVAKIIETRRDEINPSRIATEALVEIDSVPSPVAGARHFFVPTA
jgi:hypothetical protein